MQIQHKITGLTFWTEESPNTMQSTDFLNALPHVEQDGSLDEVDVRVFASVEAARAYAPPSAANVRQYGGFIEHGDDWLYWHAQDLFLRRTPKGINVGSSRSVAEYLPWLLDWLAAEQGHVLVHAAAVSWQGKGVILAGWGGAGKTSALAELLRQGGAFLADDLVFLSSEGQLGAFPKSMYVYPYHRSVYPHLFKDKTKFLIPAALSDVMAKARQIGRPLVESFPRIERLAQTWTPEHMQRKPAEAFPSAVFAETAPVDTVLNLQRADVSSPRVVPGSRGVIISRLVETLLSEISARSRLLIAQAGAAGVLSMRDWLDRRSEVLNSGLANAQVGTLMLPRELKADRVGETVTKALERGW